jgi:hypothetical protein
MIASSNVLSLIPGECTQWEFSGGLVVVSARTNKRHHHHLLEADAEHDEKICSNVEIIQRRASMQPFARWRTRTTVIASRASFWTSEDLWGGNVVAGKRSQKSILTTLQMMSYLSLYLSTDF